ncbi:uncharacterized protein CTHT_0009020 [Thermochaetoides thermophila DSM 1495]|uniref:Uncharacterized protein n=1 Tax=Chaetomium thermophilum (strain DSM 1495 / CBS 144.50 / IMI 039719) TaxID=759272 RepID=G0S075_CHATD|nr:hypothetical protein CTHT_0009020 [Thermochaetoides thermophila DSM 1495]EGS23236.1 hypothetical protein CTHT_0009020 [Thermochaetoides thermophila DSM 1495]
MSGHPSVAGSDTESTRAGLDSSTAAVHNDDMLPPPYPSDPFGLDVDLPDLSSPDAVPTYTPIDTTSLLARLNRNPELKSKLGLPLNSYPRPPWNLDDDGPHTLDRSLSEEEKRKVYTIQCEIIASLFENIAKKSVDGVRLMITEGLVSPDVQNAEQGRTPLIAAVETGSTEMVQMLLDQGAQVNAFGCVDRQQKTGRPVMRTALMVAAARGSLTLVKLLMDKYKADDSIIAPDGQLALRLAAEGKHRDVVKFLPTRRGGEWLRWKSHHEVALRRIKRAADRLVRVVMFFVYEVPVFFLWELPKACLLRPFARMGHKLWTRRRDVVRWCKLQVVLFPQRVARAGKAIWRAARKAPGAVWRVVKELPGVVKSLVKWLWRFVCRIPRIMKMAALWIWMILASIGHAVAHIFQHIIAALHTIVAAVLDFFRNITLRNVWAGVCDVFDAIFRRLPRAVWYGIKSAGECASWVIVSLFGCFGKAILLIIGALWYCAKYVPHQLWEIIQGFWSSLAKGYHELMTWFNPKYSP